MAKVDFGVIGKHMKAMDTDAMDISRQMEIKNTDGTIGSVRPEGYLYNNVPCHISFNTADNPNAQAVDVRPIVVGLTIHCSLDADLRANDYIYAKKLDNNGNVLKVYSGKIGLPTVSQGRKSVRLEVNAL